MTLKLYRIPELRPSKAKTISFADTTERDAFFASLLWKIVISTDDSTLGRITDLGKLYQQVTVFTNGRNPYTFYNYAEIISSGKSYYFYITDYREVGNSQIIYSLKKDTLMTYVTTPDQGVDVTANKALITREHKPRFTPNDLIIYDRTPEEGDQTTPIVVNETVMTAGDGKKGVRLVYKNNILNGKPVAYVFNETAGRTVTTQDSNKILEPNQSVKYVFTGDYSYSVNGGNLTTVTADWSTVYHRVFKQTSTTTVLQEVTKVGGSVTNILSTTGVVSVVITSANEAYEIGNGVVQTTWAHLQSVGTRIVMNSSGIHALPLWSSIDPYDAKNERIVELPYFDPTGINFYLDGQGIYIPLETVPKVNFSHMISPYQANFDFTRDRKPHVKGNDPKLYTSQFAPIIFTMNGVAYTIGFENINLTGAAIAEYQTFDLSNFFSVAAPNKFSTIIDSPVAPEVYNRVDQQRLTWTADNELATFKDELYTYNQYYKDLDERQLKIQEAAMLRNNILNSINQVAGIAGGLTAGLAKNEKGIAGMTPFQAAARGVQAGVNIAQIWADYADNLKMNKIAKQQKLTQLELSVSTISGGGLDFLKSFNGDKWRGINFKLQGKDFDYWDETFHRFGYSTLEYKKPVLKTRLFWDYKRMILDEVASGFVTQECIDDIRQRFAEGVTIFHKYPKTQGMAADIYDFKQEYENWEI